MQVREKGKRSVKRKKERKAGKEGELLLSDKLSRGVKRVGKTTENDSEGQIEGGKLVGSKVARVKGGGVGKEAEGGKGGGGGGGGEKKKEKTKKLGFTAPSGAGPI